MVEYVGCTVTVLLKANVFFLIFRYSADFFDIAKKGKGSPYSIAERRVPELILVLGSHKPGGRLTLLAARPAAVTLATLKRAATNFAAR